jgi:hypothetical protein
LLETRCWDERASGVVVHNPTTPADAERIEVAETAD